MNTSLFRDNYDFIICGSGPGGSVVARRLAETQDVTVLLLEAGSWDDSPSVHDAGLWMSNFGTERDWSFQGEPSPSLANRCLPYDLGKVAGGSSSINASVWMRGHRSDWDSFAEESRDAGWSYEAVLKLYQRVEQWAGPAKSPYRGTKGPVYIAPSLNVAAETSWSKSNRLAPAFLKAAAENGLTIFDDVNSKLMDAMSGASLTDLAIRGGQRSSIFKSYVAPVLAQSNIEVVRHLPGVGQNLQDHPWAALAWQAPSNVPSECASPQAVAFWSSQNALAGPDAYLLLIEYPVQGIDVADGITWAIGAAVLRPESRGRIRLSGPSPEDPPRIEGNLLSHPNDMKLLIDGIKFCHEIGNSGAMRNCVEGALTPVFLNDKGIEEYIRQTAQSGWHLCGSCKMGHDDNAVVNGALQVHGIENLRVADASVLPHVTTGNTMAPSVIVGERAAELVAAAYGLRRVDPLNKPGSFRSDHTD